jgi:hypothetical protein
MFLLAFFKSQLRQAPMLFTNSRELQGLRAGFDDKSCLTKPLEVPRTHSWRGFAGIAGPDDLVDAPAPRLRARSRVHRGCFNVRYGGGRATVRTVFTWRAEIRDQKPDTRSRLDGLTLSAVEILQRFMSVKLCSPRSIPPM